MPTAQARLGEASATPKSSLSKELGLGDGTTVQFPQAATDAVPGPSPISATAITSGAVTTRTPYPASIPNASPVVHLFGISQLRATVSRRQASQPVGRVLCPDVPDLG